MNIHRANGKPVDRSLNTAAAEAVAWVDKMSATHPRFGAPSATPKVMKEAQEFCDDPSLEEAADVFISIIGACRVRGWSPAQLASAILDKVEVLHTRTYEEQADGTWQHVKVGQ